MLTWKGLNYYSRTHTNFSHEEALISSAEKSEGSRFWVFTFFMDTMYEYVTGKLVKGTLWQILVSRLPVQNYWTFVQLE
jgi:hypothetical protein